MGVHVMIRLKSREQDTYYSNDKSGMLEFIPLNITSLLDIGCAEGRFGQTVKAEHDTEVWGVELFPEAAEIARSRIDKVFIGDIECVDIQRQLPDNFFDCIVFNDVLEHLQDPWALLRKIHEKLKSDGTIVALIPNVRHYETMKKLIIHKEFEYESSGVRDITHLRFFTEKSMIRTFESSGYMLKTITGINGGFPWKFYLLNKLLCNTLYDMQFLHFACVAVKNEKYS